MKFCNCDSQPDAGRRAFFASAAAVAVAGSASGLSAEPAPIVAPEIDRRKFMAEATRLAIESVEKGWGGPFGAVIVKDGEIIGRGQNRVLLTGCPVFHAEVTAIIDASGRLNPKALLGSDYGPGTMLEMIPREADSPDPVPERARMLKGCEIYINGAPCPMCMSAIYWSRIDRVYFGASLEDTSKIGFDDAFQYADFKLPWEKRRIAVTPGFEREAALRLSGHGRTSRIATPIEMSLEPWAERLPARIEGLECGRDAISRAWMRQRARLASSQPSAQASGAGEKRTDRKGCRLKNRRRYRPFIPF